MTTSKYLHRVLAAGALAAVIATPSIAKADYVCSSFFNPDNTSLGDEGYVYATYYSGPNCTGSYVSSKAYCSPGANTVSCASDPGYHYDRPSLLLLAEMLRAAGEAGQRVYVWSAACFFGSNGCGSVVNFQAG